MGGTKYRTEADSMGKVIVPRDALYGAQTQRAINNFTIAKSSMRWEFIEALLFIKLAACKANNELSLLDNDSTQGIEKAIKSLLEDEPLEQFPVAILQTGSGTSTNMNVNEVVANLVNSRSNSSLVSPNDHINLGQSSNDVIPASIHVANSRGAVNTLLPSIKTLQRTILDFGATHSDVIKTGRTHLMDALPMKLQAEMEAWAAQLEESTERIESCLSRLSRLPLGGTAIGSGVNSHPDFPQKVTHYLSELTGLNFTPAPSKYKNISSLDTIVEYSGHMKTLAISLSKIANDLRWMNSGPHSGLAEISLPSLQPGSSIMPAKVNPVIPEAVCMAAAQVIGNDTTISLGALGGNFQLNTMLPLVAEKTLESLELLSGSCESLATKAIKGMKVNRDNIQKPLLLNPILVTALNPIIGYQNAAEIGKTAQKEKRTVLDVALEKTDIPRKELERLLDPKNLADGNDRRSKR